MSKFSRMHYELEHPVIARPTMFHVQPARVVVAEYGVNKQKAIVGLALENNARLWTATVNLIDLPANDGCVWIDNNGPNEGLFDELVRLGVIRFNNRFACCKSGYVFECQLMI